MSIVVNLFAGPGTGKSTTAAEVFQFLKWRDVNCEMALEYAKDKVWEESLGVLACQPYVFGKQLFRLSRLQGKVDVIVTDSPLLLSCIYGKKEPSAFHELVTSKHHGFDNMNFFLKRTKPYNPKGRLQDYTEAQALDEEIRSLLIRHHIRFKTVDAKKGLGTGIGSVVLDELRSRGRLE